MMKMNKEELAILGYNDKGNLIMMGGQFKAKNVRQYFDDLKKNLIGQ